jgi:hypothetical protein
MWSSAFWYCVVVTARTVASVELSASFFIVEVVLMSNPEDEGNMLLRSNCTHRQRVRSHCYSSELLHLYFRIMVPRKPSGQILTYLEPCWCLWPVYRRVREIATGDCWLRRVCLSIWLPTRPSVCVCASAWNNTAHTGRIFMKFDTWVFFRNLSTKLEFS